MCDGDGDVKYETRLSPDDQPHHFQQSAAKHGHLGDFHFVFKRVNGDDDETDNDEDTDADSDAEIFQQATQIKVWYILHIPSLHISLPSILILAQYVQMTAWQVSSSLDGEKRQK